MSSSPSQPAQALAIEGLSHWYGDREALAGVSLTVEAGGIVGLLGPNGGGKTTLFRIVTTLLTTPPGHVHVFGHDVARAPEDVRRLLGVVFQAPALDPRLTVVENLRTHGHLYALRGDRLETRVSETLAHVDLADRAEDNVGTLSGGLQRRVEIAKALMPEPRLLMLDEPSTGLDPGARRDLWDHLAHLRDTLGTTVVLTTHLMDEAARCDAVALLHKGHLVAHGNPRDLISEIGGDVILVASSDVDGLADDIRTRFDQPAEVVDGHVRIERQDGHRLLAELVEAFPERIDGITFGKPTLEDVFLHHTGDRWTLS